MDLKKIKILPSINAVIDSVRALPERTANTMDKLVAPVRSNGSLTIENGHCNNEGISFRQQQALLSLVDYLEKRGVDVSQLKTAVQNHDTAAISAWFEASRQVHVKSMVDRSRQHIGQSPGKSYTLPHYTQPH
jgi:hypothetical protein